MVLRPHYYYTFLIGFICLLIFAVINSNFFVSYRFPGTTFQEKSVQKIDWSYKLNLTSKFIPITEKEINLFSKLKSIQVYKFIWWSISFLISIDYF